ncbi:hypothetical protein [Streptomyces clavuligerus]|uniref:Uncharacterized protein n=1 Tax=Streptomyces clavuligerus TaxID=1901 RepID=B5GM11_STRCL|nr:hypothetical protein [Streptomyces clavuligerus]EDY47357.1 hypothetical protein SSCG_00385 [Streptomyces clavuligerus]EFG05012.1 Hypothetical protein SCLAV_p1531 [Streptomyces clavuligerus]
MISRALRDGASTLPRPTHTTTTDPAHIQHTEPHTTTRGLGRTANQLGHHE